MNKIIYNQVIFSHDSLIVSTETIHRNLVLKSKLL